MGIASLHPSYGLPESLGVDGFGLVCIHYSPDGAAPPGEQYSGRQSGGGSWQSVCASGRLAKYSSVCHN